MPTKQLTYVRTVLYELNQLNKTKTLEAAGKQTSRKDSADVIIM